MASWYRSYGETLNDPKVQRLSLVAFKAWHNALYLACSIDSADGNIGNIDSVSFAFRETNECVSRAFQELEGAGLIETVGETFHISAWKKRQYKSDTSTSRVKKYRAKVKRCETVTETPPDTDTDTDTDTDRKIKIETKVSTKKGSRISDDWIPDFVESDKIGLSRKVAQQEADKFKDYWKSKTGKDASKMDWAATWRNWCRNARPSSNLSRASLPYQKATLTSLIMEENKAKNDTATYQTIEH